MPITKKSIENFISAYGREDDIEIKETQGEDYKYTVTHEENEYCCKDITTTADCVNHIIFDLDMYRAVKLSTTGKTVKLLEK